MSHQELAAALDVVHREIAESGHLDAADVARLRATMAQIQVALDQRDESESQRDERESQREERESQREEQETLTGSVSESVSKSARRFEESHPVLTETLGRVADILQQMGI